MNKVEIKKALYKQNPTAKITSIKDGCANYTTTVNGDAISFKVPITDMGEAEFTATLPAKLLIRWLQA